MSRSSFQDTPYRDDPSPRSAPTPNASAPRTARKPSTPHHRPRPERAAPPAAHHAAHHAATIGSTATPPRRRSSRRGGRRGAGSPSAVTVQLTSQPTSRNAYVETRAWLLERHGPVCAYCGNRFSARVMTLDHVTPRRGQTAYDRRDNLVLACPGCNAAKRDTAPLAFLLAVRGRAVNLLRYGAHLSPMLVDLARSLVPAGTVVPPADETRPAPGARAALDDLDDDGESPYRD